MTINAKVKPPVNRMITGGFYGGGERTSQYHYPHPNDLHGGHINKKVGRLDCYPTCFFLRCQQLLDPGLRPSNTVHDQYASLLLRCYR